MQKSPEFIVVNMLRSNKSGENKVRKETIRVDNIEFVRNYHNKGKHGVDESLPLAQITLKSPIVDEDNKGEKLFKLLVQEDFEAINIAIGSVKVS